MILNRSLVSDVGPTTNIFHRRIQQKDTVSSERLLGEISMLVSACRKIVSSASAVLCGFLFALRTYLCERPHPLSFLLRRHHRCRSSSRSSSSSCPSSSSFFAVSSCHNHEDASLLRNASNDLLCLLLDFSD